jgi:hypothetical protein
MYGKTVDPSDFSRAKTTVGADRGAGLPAFSYYMPYHPRFWNQVKAVLAAGIPILMRRYPGMEYPMPTEDLHSTVDREGHVVMIIGYDERTREVIIIDPWNSQWGGVWSGRIRLPYADFDPTSVDNTLDYTDTPVPWEMDLFIRKYGTLDQGLHQIVARVHYRCPEPFDYSRHLVVPLLARIDLPQGLKLHKGETAEKTYAKGISPRETVKIHWIVKQDGTIDGNVTVRVRGIVHGREPYPYMDIVGARATLPLRLEAPSKIEVLAGILV